MSCSVISPILYKKSIFNRIKKFWFFVFEYFSNIICFIAYLVTATILLETYLEFDFSCILSFFIFLLQTYYNIYLKHIPFFFQIILGIYHKPFLQPLFLVFIILSIFLWALFFISLMIISISQLQSALLFSITKINNFFIFIAVCFHSCHCMHSFVFTHEAKVNSIIFSPHSNNCSIVKNHGFLCYIMVAIASFLLKSKIYHEKVSVMTNNTPTCVKKLININAFGHINPNIFQHLQLFRQPVQAISHSRKLVEGICHDLRKYF